MLFDVLRRQTKGLLAIFFCWTITWSVEAVDFMPVSEVQTGMKGIAKTVVVGEDISEFDVEVLGVMKDRGPSGDLILARFSGPIMDEYGGIAHGMSGSPVYIDGKLVGAVAYGWGFADSKIGMITPIEDMVKLWNIPYEKYLPKPWSGDGEIIPMKTPLMAYGFDGDALSYMENKLKAYQFETYGTAGSSSDEVAKPLVPGGSVAALLVNGDLKLGAIGTVTHVDGDRVVAFGHSFLKRGAMQYYMHNAHIFTVVSSVQSSFKLGSMGAPVGAVTEDRGAGIAGITGHSVAAIPLSVSILDRDTGKTRKAYVNVIEDEDLTPALSATSVYSFLNKTLDRTGTGTSKVTMTLLPRDNKYAPLTRTNYFYSSSAISEKSVDEYYNILESLLGNSFVNYELMDMKVDVEVTKARETAKIVDASAAPAIVSPGDEVFIKVKLHPFRGEELEKDLTFKVPKNQPFGKMTLEIRGGGVVPLPYLLEKQKYNLTDEIIRRLKTYKNFDDYYDKLRKSDSNHEIVVEILEEGVSMVDSEEGEASSNAKLQEVEKNPLPGNIHKPEKVEAKAIPEEDEKKSAKVKLPTTYVIYGDGQLTLQVMSPEARKKAITKKQKEASKEVKATMKDEKSILEGDSAKVEDNKPSADKEKPGEDTKPETDKKPSEDKKP